MSKEKIFARLGFSGLIVEKEELKHLKLSCVNQKGESVNLECYLVTYELEDGTECNEDGSPLDY